MLASQRLACRCAPSRQHEGRGAERGWGEGGTRTCETLQTGDNATETGANTTPTNTSRRLQATLTLPSPASGRGEPRVREPIDLEPRPELAIRLGLQLIRGLSEDAAQRIVAARTTRAFTDVQDLVERARLSRDEREKLAAAGALKRLAGHRHRAFWQVAGSERHDDLLAGSRHAEVQQPLPLPSRAENTFADYAATGLSLADHPLKLVRAQLRARRIRRACELPGLRDGLPVRVAGLVTMRQRPGTATGVTFVTLEDETGLVNLVVWATVAERQRRPLLEARLLGVDGVLQAQHGVIHVVAGRLHDLSPLLAGLDSRSRDFH